MTLLRVSFYFSAIKTVLPFYEHAVIKPLFLENVALKQINNLLLKLYKDFSPSITTVERWIAEAM